MKRTLMGLLIVALLVGAASADPFIGPAGNPTLRYSINIADGVDMTALGDTDVNWGTGDVTTTGAGTGEAFLEASIDQGDSWLEVSSNSQWVDGAENEIYVPQAEGYVEVWIRWRCDGDITSLSIDDLQIVQLRAVSDADVPKIPAGEERVLQVSGTGRAIISAEYRDRFKP